MSVLYKALQKAEKENEQRQSATAGGFDTQGLAASGALKFAGSKSAGANRIAMAVIVVVAVAGGGAFLLFKDQLMSSAPPVAQAPASPAPQTAEAVLQPPPTAAQAPMASEAASESASEAETQVAAADSSTDDMSAEATQESEVDPTIAEAAATSPPEEDVDSDVEMQVAAAPAVARPAARQSASAARSAPPRAPEPMPTLAPNAPARMLSPPINIRRAEFELAGVGNQVQVREVSQLARSNVAAGYDALMGGSYDTALGFYDAALKEEPTSVLALLGRGAALQKLGRGQEAHGSYDQVLKLDPQNREALTNITAIAGERAPEEALSRLLQLESEYPAFSPVKAQIGLAYAKTGSMQQALDYFRRALSLSPDTVMYHYNMALVLDHMGRGPQAVESYNRVLAAFAGGRGPSDLSADQIERRVRFLQSR